MKTSAAVAALLAVLGVSACGNPISSDTKYGKLFATHSTLNKARVVIGEWNREFGRYPPTTLSAPPTFETGPGTNNGVCEGIEAVYQILLWPGFRIDADWDAAQLGNVDDDKASAPLNRTGQRDLMELVDAWGNPLVYFHHDDYERLAKTGAPYLTKDGIEVSPRPYVAADGSFVNLDSFQLYSMGPDSKPNTADDLVSWDR